MIVLHFTLCVADVIFMVNHGIYLITGSLTFNSLHASRGSEEVKSYSQLATLAAEESEEEEVR